MRGRVAEIERLRAALIRSGRAADCLLADAVSTDFLMLVPAEVEGSLDILRAEIARRDEVLTDLCNSWDCPNTPFTPQMPRIYAAARALTPTTGDKDKGI